MKNVVPVVVIAIIGVAVWLALKAKYDILGVWRRFLGIWRKDPRFRETTIFGSVLIMSLVIFTILPGLLL